MKFKLLSSACGVALLATTTPSIAGNDFSGVAKAYIAGGTAEGSALSDFAVDDPFAYGIEGKGYWPLSPNAHLQVDLFAERTNDLVSPSVSSQQSASQVGGAVHLLHPLGDRARLGVAGSIWSNDVFVTAVTGPDPDDVSIERTDATYGLAALEGQFFGTDWTVMGQAGIFSAIDCSDVASSGCFGTIDDGSYVRGKVRYFITDNTVLSLETMQMWGDVNNDGVLGGKSITTQQSMWALEAEHRFENSPFSGLITVSHERNEADWLLTSSVDTSTVQVGFKFYLDEPSLKSNDRTGAELDTPTFGGALETSSPALGALGLLDSIPDFVEPDL
jgi:hypothetical protein